MLDKFLRWIGYSLAIIFVAWVVPGIHVANFLTAMLVCVVLALINIFVKPILEFISLPINFLTFGLFTFILNALLLILAGKITPGFEVHGFMSALIGSIIFSLLAYGISRINSNEY